MAKSSKIKTTATEEDPIYPGGDFEDGSIVESVYGDEVVKEKLVYEYDDEGNYIGFKKEVANG